MLAGCLLDTGGALLGRSYTGGCEEQCGNHFGAPLTVEILLRPVR
jgi:hypothetical protein